MAILLPLRDIPQLHTTPLATIRVEYPKLIIEADDIEEKRVRFIFQPYQAMRVITSDCFKPPNGLQIIPRIISEVINSSWINELKCISHKTDHTAEFMNKSRHFIFPMQDEFVEVVAWNIQNEEIE